MNADTGASASLRPSLPGSSDHKLVVIVAWLAIAAPLMVLGGLLAVPAPSVPWFAGIVVGALAAMVIIVLRLRGAVSRVLRATRAEAADPVVHARPFNLVRGLSLAGGISKPELYVVLDEARNAAAVAQGDRSAVILTSGLLDVADRIALEGAIAEALVRIRNGDAEAATTGAALFGVMLAGPLAALTRPLAAFGLRRLLGPDRDLAADRAAVALTRYPPGLLAALDLIRAGSPAVSRTSGANDHIWLVAPTALDADAESVLPGAALDLRIDVLGEL